MLIGVLVMIGWLFGIEFLKRVMPHLQSMKFNTALGLLLAGAALRWRDRAPIRIGLGMSVSLLGALTLGEHLINLDLGIDQFVVPSTPDGSTSPGRMSPATALCFVFIGVAMGLMEAQHALWRGWAETLTIAVMVINVLALIGYALGAEHLYSMPGFTSLALHTAAAFVILTTGLLGAVKESILTQLIYTPQTHRPIWFGFGLLTFLLIVTGIFAIGRLHAVRADIDMQVNISRPLMDATKELHVDVVGYGLGVKAFAQTGDPQDWKAAAEDATHADHHLEIYARLATSQRQQELASRFSSDWQALKRIGQSLVTAEEHPPNPHDFVTFSRLSMALEQMLENEIQPEAAASLDTARLGLPRNLLDTEAFMLQLLALGVVLALVIGGKVARTVRRGEAALRESEAFSQQIISNIEEGLIVFDADLRCRVWNRFMEKVSGMPADRMVGRHPDELFPWTRDKSISAGLKQALTGRVVLQPDALTQHAQTGREIWLTGRTGPLRDARGGICGVVTVMQDISERKQLEQERQKFISLADRSVEFIGMCDLEFNPFYVNAAGLRLVGLDDLESAFRVKVPEFFFPEDQAFITQKFFPDVLQNGRGEVEIRFRHFKTKEAIWMLYNVFSICDANGAIVAWATVSRDIHDRRLAEQALRERQEDLNRAQAVGHIGSWRMDVRRNVLTWSPENHRIFGIPEGSPMSYETFLATVHPDDRNYVDRMWQAALRRAPYDIEHRIVVDGRVKWVREKAELEFDETNKLLGGFGTTQDITEKRNIEEALREANHRKDEFLAMLGHELRNPLTPISTVVQMMCSQALDESKLVWARQVLSRNVAQISRLVDDLLDVSRITRGLVTLKREHVELAPLLKESSETIQGLTQAKHQTLHFDLPRQPIYLEGDSVRLIQIFTNLLNNAAKYTGEGGRIDVLASVEGPIVVIRIRDNGMGIAPQLLPHVFDLFTQGDRGLDRAEGGLGIGLTLVKKLVELHGGHIAAHSPGINRGSEFVVQLPRLVGAAAQMEPLNPAGLIRESSRGLRILLIDDNPDVVDSIALLLEMSGHHVEIAPDGPKGLSIAHGFAPEVILLDIGLPGMDGYQVARRLREQPSTRQALIIAMSGYALNKNDSRAGTAGFDHCLIKPPDLGQLRNLILEYQRAGQVPSPAQQAPLKKG